MWRCACDEFDRNVIGQLQWCLSTQTDDYSRCNSTRQCFRFDHIHYIFLRQWFEVQAIRGVVVGRHRFRIAVDHDRFETCIAESKTRVYTAVVKFDSLTNAIWPTTQNNYFGLRRVMDFILVFVRRVVVRSLSSKLGTACINCFIRRNYTCCDACCSHS